MGLWQPPPEALEKLRQAVADKWDRWSAILAALPGWSQMGEPLKRVPRGFDASHPAAAELKRTSFIATVQLEPAELETRDAVDHVLARLRPTHDYLAFLCEALALPF